MKSKSTFYFLSVVIRSAKSEKLANFTFRMAKKVKSKPFTFAKKWIIESVSKVFLRGMAVRCLDDIGIIKPKSQHKMFVKYHVCPRQLMFFRVKAVFREIRGQHAHIMR